MTEPKKTKKFDIMEKLKERQKQFVTEGDVKIQEFVEMFGDYTKRRIEGKNKPIGEDDYTKERRDLVYALQGFESLCEDSEKSREFFSKIDSEQYIQLYLLYRDCQAKAHEYPELQKFGAVYKGFGLLGEKLSELKNAKWPGTETSYFYGDSKLMDSVVDDYVKLRRIQELISNTDPDCFEPVVTELKSQVDKRIGGLLLGSTIDEEKRVLTIEIEGEEKKVFVSPLFTNYDDMHSRMERAIKDVDSLLSKALQDLPQRSLLRKILDRVRDIFGLRTTLDKKVKDLGARVEEESTTYKH